MKNHKAKIYPSPSPSSAVSPSPPGDFLSVFSLLPPAILTLAAVLSLEDRQVLAYMITKSIKSTIPKRKPSNPHKPPVFDCDCFDCYTSYWFKWDSSPNRELIHQAIEAFEEHLSNGEKSKKRNKKKERTGHRRLTEKPVAPLPEIEIVPEFVGKGEEYDEDNDGVLVNAEEVAAATVRAAAAESQYKGLARTVLPDVLGLFNSGLWGLWSPNV